VTLRLDKPMIDEGEICRVAAEYVERWGVSRAVEYFIDRATRSAGNGDALSARAWSDIAQAAREIDEDGWRT
jgi:hypothetical protein